ncbi:MAG: ribbon-helix-helix protein, CopG family [Deltaproteobacteria bacterium]|nr:ribbon-helix-helix protein, CopG family [Deltaproteobacteria bacterium]
MAALETRTTVLFEPSQYRELKRIAEAEGRPVAELIRDAVAQRYRLATREERVQAVERLAALSAPVGDWKQMEAEILRGALE